MKKWFILGGALVLVLVLGTALWAQNAANSGNTKGSRRPGMMRGFMPPMMGPGASVMHADASGLFLLERGTLTKYDAATLQSAGTVDLKPATATPDTTTTTPKRPLGLGGEAFMLASVNGNDTVLAVVAGTFYAVNAGTLATQAQGALPDLPTPTALAWAGKRGATKPGATAPPSTGTQPDTTTGTTDSDATGTPNTALTPGARGLAHGKGGQWGPGRMGMGMMRGGLPGMEPTLELTGTTLYVKRGLQIASVDVTTGKVIAQTTLPLPTPPAQNDTTTAPPTK